VLERGVEEGLVGLKLPPRKDRTAARNHCQQQEHARNCGPKPLAALARPLGATEDFVGADAGEGIDYLGEAEVLAIAAVTQIGAGDRD